MMHAPGVWCGEEVCAYLVLTASAYRQYYSTETALVWPVTNTQLTTSRETVNGVELNHGL